MATIDGSLANSYPTSGPIADYLDWAHELTHAPPIAHLVSILPLLSYELTRRGFTLPAFDDTLTLWFGMVAPPASAKTSAMYWAQDFSSDLYESMIGADLAPRPWVTLEGSMQGVLHTMADRGDDSTQITSGILFHPEASKVFLHEDAPATLCSVYDGRDIDRNFRYLQKAKQAGENPIITIRAPRFSALLTTTKASLKPVVRRDVLEGGLFSRILWFVEAVKPEELMPQPLRNDAKRQWTLGRWQQWFRTMDGWQARGLSTQILLDGGAMQFLHEQLFNRLRPHMASETLEAGIATRALAHATRLAAIYAANRLSIYAPDEGKPQLVVTQDDLLRASNLVWRSVQAAFELGGQISALKLDRDQKRKVLEKAIMNAGPQGLPRSSLYKLFGGHVDKPQLDLLLQELEESDLVVILRVVGKGRPSVRAVHQAFVPGT